MLVENELKRLKTFDAAYFRDKNYFDGNDGAQSYSVFQPVYKCFKLNNGKVSSWDSKGLSNEKITSVSVDIFSQIDNLPKLVHSNDVLELRLLKIPLKQDKAIYKHGPTVNIYIVYKLITSSINTGITLHNCLFGAVQLTKKC